MIDIAQRVERMPWYDIKLNLKEFYLKKCFTKFFQCHPHLLFSFRYSQVSNAFQWAVWGGGVQSGVEMVSMGVNWAVMVVLGFEL